MSGLLPDVDPDGLLEYSVVFTDRSLNHMSGQFVAAMQDISATLREVYRADGIVLVPGGGTFGMEAVARQFANGCKVLVVRNGYFSYRWSQILEAGRIADEVEVMQAGPVAAGPRAPFAPPDAAAVASRIRAQRPAVVFAPHVETSAGILVPDEWIADVAKAAHDVGALMVLDGVASGALWTDMRATGVDVLISAPQKGWSASPCSAMVMLSARAMERLGETRSSSFAADLRRWREIMQAYENGGHAYHATMPTDALMTFRDAMREAAAAGFDALRDAQIELGRQVRAALSERGYASVAAPGFEAPGVVVSYTDDADIQNGSRLAAAGIQIAAGVPLMCDEPDDFRTFRIGLFGLDKLADPAAATHRLCKALDTLATQTHE